MHPSKLLSSSAIRNGYLHSESVAKFFWSDLFSLFGGDGGGGKDSRTVQYIPKPCLVTHRLQVHYSGPSIQPCFNPVIPGITGVTPALF